MTTKIRSSAPAQPSIMQVLTFYENYLQEFYSQRPHLCTAPYHVQLRELYLDCFCAPHIHAEYMSQHGMSATWTVGNNFYLQRQWAEENGVTFRAESWHYDILREQVDKFCPTIFYVLNPIDFDSRFTRTLKHRPELIVGWRAAPIPKETDWGDFDLILSHLDICRKLALEHGARDAAFFRPAVPEILQSVASGISPAYDVIFAGQWTPLHHDRNQILLALGEAAHHGLFSLGLYLSVNSGEIPPTLSKYCLPAQWGRSMFRALRTGKIVINAEIDMAKGNAGNLRLFETTAVGGFLLTEYHENLTEYFTPGVHLDTYQSLPELIDKIRYYLAHEDVRLKIARQGQEHVHKVFGMHTGAPLLLQTIGDHVARRSLASMSA